PAPLVVLAALVVSSGLAVASGSVGFGLVGSGLVGRGLGRGTDRPDGLADPRCAAEDDGQAHGVGPHFGRTVHGDSLRSVARSRTPPAGARAGHGFSSYPASSTASLTSASSMGASLVTVTRPVSRSTSTPVTPAIWPTSSLTELTQWPQVIPVTV